MKTYQVIAAGGLGDVVMCLCAAAGLARQHPDDDVVLVAPPHRLGWCRLFTGFGRLASAEEPPHAAHRTYRPHPTWTLEYSSRARKARWEYYGDACNTTACCPGVAPAGEAEREWAARWCDAVLLCPWSNEFRRDWLAPHWRHLETLLNERGYRTVVTDARPEKAAWLRSEFVGAETPARIGALMHAAACVVGNDSGLAHVAGAMGRPVVVPCGALRGQPSYGLYPRARWIDGPLPCGGCYWNGEFTTPACSLVCANLQAIRAEEVLRLVEEVTAG